MALDPYNLTPAASLNRVRLVSSERLRVPLHLEGRQAAEVLSAQALQDIVAEQAEAQALTGDAHGGPATLLTGWLESSHEPARRAGNAALEEHATRLAYLIATLKLGEAEARAARPEWDDSYWRHWATIGRIYLAGGLAYEELGGAADAKLQTLGVRCQVLTSPHAPYAPLIGAARTLTPAAGAATIFDFGGTTVKRGIAGYQGGRLSSFQVLPALPSPQRSGDRSPLVLAEVIVATISADPARPAAFDVAVSIASYVAGNHLLEAPHATYVDLRGIENLGSWLSGQVERRLGVPIAVRLIHDGTAGALAVSPSPDTAVITTGTFLGIGFARASGEGLASIEPAFRIMGAGT